MTSSYGGADSAFIARDAIPARYIRHMKISRLKDHVLPSGVLGLAVTPDGRRAYAACADGVVYDVDMENGKFEPFAEKHASFASGCALLPDGQTLISAGY